jgi:hypothetical protein
MLVRPVDHDRLVAIDRSGETVTDLMALLRAPQAHVVWITTPVCGGLIFTSNRIRKETLFTSTK